MNSYFLTPDGYYWYFENGREPQVVEVRSGDSAQGIVLFTGDAVGHRLEDMPGEFVPINPHMVTC